MVLIQPTPSGNTTGAPGQDVDSKALTKEGIEAEQGRTIPQDQAKNKESLLSSSTSDELMQGKPDISQLTRSAPSRSSQPGSIDFADSADPSGYWSPPQRAAPTETWTSESTNRKRQFLLVGFFGLTSIAISGLLMMMLLRWYQSDSTADSIALSQDQTSQQSDDSAVQPEGPESADSDPPELADSSPATTELEAPAESDVDVPEAAAMAEVVVVEREGTAGQEAIRHPNETSSVPEDPTASADSQSPEATNPIDGLPRQLRELAELLAQPFELTTPQTVTLPDRPPVTAEELGLTASRSDRSLPPIDVHVLSQERLIRGLRIADMPLAHAVNYLSLVSGIPSRVDLRSMAASGRDFSSPISFLLESGNVAELGQKFAQDAGIQLRPVDNRYWRFFCNSPNVEMLPWQSPIDDLVRDEQEAVWFRETLSALFPESAASIRLSDGQLSADSETVDRLDWFDVIRWIENWRHQQGLPSRFPEYPPGSLRMPFVQSPQVAGLEQSLKEITSSPQALASFLSMLCAQAGLNCWIDWPALNEIGLSPSSPVLSVTYNRPLRNVLSELAFEYGITAVILDEQTLWITQQNAYRMNSEVFVLPNEGQDADYWYQYLRPLTPIGADGVSQIQLRISPDQQLVMVRCCRPSLDFN
jgi:hypothetical protein